MDKTLLKNHWILVGLLVVIAIILELILVGLGFTIRNVGNIIIAGTVGAMAIGQIYSQTFKEIMPKQVRRKVTVTYILAQMALGSGYILVLESPDYFLFFGILTGISLLEFLLMYWALDYGGKTYLRALQKRKAMKKSTKKRGMFLSILFIFIILLLVIYTLRNYETPLGNPKMGEPEKERMETSQESPEKVKCESEGGEWSKEGLLQEYRCVLPYPDAGKACTNSTECQGECIANLNGTGHCQYTDSPFGCYRTIEQFRKGDARLCRD